MITLSEFLNTIPFPESASKSVQVAIREAKRLESLETPRVESKRKPLVDDEGDGLCPTIPVATFTPEREHEWVIFRPSSCHKLWSWAARIPDGGYWWCNDPLAPSILKFTSSKEAQEYIDNAQKQHYNIDMLDAFPWIMPKWCK